MYLSARVYYVEVSSVNNIQFVNLNNILCTSIKNKAGEVLRHDLVTSIGATVVEADRVFCTRDRQKELDNVHETTQTHISRRLVQMCYGDGTMVW